MKFEKKAGYYELDVTGYVCPHPQLYTIKCLEKIPEGSELRVLIDNPSSVESVTQVCNSKGLTILGTSSPKDGVTEIRIQR